MATDIKEVQTMINRTGQSMLIIREEVSKIQAIKSLFQTANPSVTGTPLDGNVTALNNALTALQTEVDKAIWTGVINAIVPSHRGEAL